jgi:cellulose synthase operon protein C
VRPAKFWRRRSCPSPPDVWGFAFQEALQAQPDNLAYLLLEHGGDVNSAVSYAQIARKGMPDLPNSADTLGWAYYYQGAYASAVDLFQEAIKGAPDNPTYHYHLGMTYQKLNDFPKAKQEFEETLKLAPKYPHADEIKQALAQAPQGN